MSYFLHNPVSQDELIFWNDNKNINPRTKRKIKENGPIYKYLQKEYIKYTNNENYNILQITINQEPITLDKFYDDNTKKILVNQDEYIIYKDNKHILGFHYSSILGLKNAKVFIHPITRNIIPKNIFNKAEELATKFNFNNNVELSLRDLCLKAFHYFNNLSIFINEDEFLKLNNNKYKKLSFELKSFFDKNLSINQKKHFKKYDYFKDENPKKIIQEIIFLMENVKEQDKIFISYIILGGLVLVMPNLKKEYPFLEYSFNTNNI